MYVFSFFNLLGLSLASSRKQFCYPQRQSSKQLAEVTRETGVSHLRLKSLSINLQAGRKGLPILQRRALRWILKNRKETQRRTDQLCLHGCNHLREEGIILFNSSRRCNPSWQPWLVAWFPSEIPLPALVWDSLPTATIRGQILAQFMPWRQCNQPGQSFLSFLRSRTQPSRFLQVPRRTLQQQTGFCPSPFLEPLAPTTLLPVTPGPPPGSSFSSAFKHPCCLSQNSLSLPGAHPPFQTMAHFLFPSTAKFLKHSLIAVVASTHLFPIFKCLISFIA